MIKSVLVELDYTADLDHPRFDYAKGYLVDENHVLLIDENERVWLYSVQPTPDPLVFKRDQLALQLGLLLDAEDEVELVTRLHNYLNELTAWQFLTRCFPFPNPDIEFELIERMG